jgi:CheY-like chemotaxis protein
MAVVLVVDDEPLQAGILKTILEKGGYETHTASSGKEALGLVARLCPDVILTDLRMDGMDGIELIAAVPREPSSRR